MTTDSWPRARPPPHSPPAQQPGPRPLRPALPHRTTWPAPWRADHQGEDDATLGLPWPLDPTGATTGASPPQRRLPCVCALVACPVLYSWLPDPTLPQRAASERSSDRPPPHPALVWMRGVLSAPDPNTDTGERTFNPLILICSVGTRHQKFRLCLFFPSKKPGQKYPPRMGPRPKNYHMKNSSGIYATMVAIATRWQTLEGIS